MLFQGLEDMRNEFKLQFKTSKFEFKYYMSEKNGGYHNEIVSQNMDC